MVTLVTARLATATVDAQPVESPTISYDPTVLEALRRMAQTAFDCGQQPVMGLLLGRRTHYNASITAWLPANTLTTGRDANLSRALELARLEYPTETAIGWFRSKHQGEARLGTEELESGGNVIAGGIPIALVLRPSSQRPLRVATYLPQPGIPVAGERPFQEFFIHPEQKPVNVSPVSVPLMALPLVEFSDRSRSTSRFKASLEGLRWAFPAGLLILIAIAALGTAQIQTDDAVVPFAVLAKSANPAPARTTMPNPLRISARGNQWLLRWDSRAPADRATLVITRNGKKQLIALTPSEYAAGSYSLPAIVADDVEILLRSQKNDQAAVEVRTRIVGSATALPPSLNPKADAGELDRVKIELQQERARRQRLSEMIDAQNKSR